MTEDTPTVEDPTPMEDSHPISRFVCHKTDRDLARKVLLDIGKAADPGVTLGDIRLDTMSGVIKNRLVGLTPENLPVFAIHLRTGRHLDPANCLLKAVPA